MAWKGKSLSCHGRFTQKQCHHSLDGLAINSHATCSKVNYNLMDFVNTTCFFPFKLHRSENFVKAVILDGKVDSLCWKFFKILADKTSDLYSWHEFTCPIYKIILRSLILHTVFAMGANISDIIRFFWMPNNQMVNEGGECVWLNYSSKWLLLVRFWLPDIFSRSLWCFQQSIANVSALLTTLSQYSCIILVNAFPSTTHDCWLLLHNRICYRSVSWSR